MRILSLSRHVDIPAQELVRRLAARPGTEVETMVGSPAGQAMMRSYAPCEPFDPVAKLDPRAILRLRRKFREGRFDVVQAWSTRLLTNALLACTGLAAPPAIVGFVGFIGRFSRWNPEHRLVYLHPRLAAIWCNCDAARRPLVALGVPPQKLHTIYFGHPVQQRSDSPRAEVRLELGIPTGAVVVGFAGNMRRVKGVDVLLEAALKLKNTADLHWILAGRVEDRRVNRLLDDPQLRGRVHSLGWRDDADRVMQAFDIFAMPSRSEGFSRAIIEAMELGLCPVATNVGGTPEMVRDGQDGLIVPPDDVDVLVTAIAQLVGDAALRQQLATSARRRIEETFTIDRMVTQAIALYESLQSAPKISAAA